MITAIHEAPIFLRTMSHEDLSLVSDIERRSYEFPWSHGVFRDCLLAGYQCVVLERNSDVAGYSVLSIAAGEAHILNICVDPDFRSMGYGEQLLDEVLFRTRTTSVREIFLEVRPSNHAALNLYRSVGFDEVGVRPSYYQAQRGREDAVILTATVRSLR